VLLSFLVHANSKYSDMPLEKTAVTELQNATYDDPAMCSHDCLTLRAFFSEKSAKKFSFCGEGSGQTANDQAYYFTSGTRPVSGRKRFSK